MSAVDERIVRMSFDNAQFQANVAATMSQLQELNKNLKLAGATKGLQDISGAAKNVQLGGIAKGVDAIREKFSALSLVGIGALTSIGSRATQVGLNFVKSFTLDPITQGFKAYETQINAVQTILANTGLKGAEGLSKVTAVLDDLQEYANKTVYSFSEMAKNIGTFTAAGVKLDVAKDAIKGIANLAALSGSNSEQASTAMYQLSQAIAANKVGLQDWNSVVNAGMGGEVFQKALFNAGVQLKTIKDVPMGQTFEEWKKAGNSFRGSLQDGWITGEVLTKTLSQFTGDLTDAELKSQGYNDTQIKQIQELAKTAVGAATNIKTFSQLTDALKEETASAFGDIFKTMFGGIDEATTMFTKIHEVVSTAILTPLNKVNEILQQFKFLGGKVAILDTIKTGLQFIKSIIEPIRQAFRDIFPATTAVKLAQLAKAMQDLVHRFKIGSETLENLKRTFRGVFAAVDIVFQVIKQLAAGFIGLFKSLGGGGLISKILEFTGKIGDMVTNFDKAVKKGDGLKAFFKTLESVLGPVGEAMSKAGSAVINALSNIPAAFEKVKEKIEGFVQYIKPAIEKIKNFFKNMFEGVTFEDVGKTLLGGLGIALGVGVLKLIKTIRERLSGGGGNLFSGLVSSITEPFEQLTETLKSMQQSIKAVTLLEIAAAVGILTLSVVALSKINAASLTKALVAMGAMFAMLSAALFGFGAIGARGMISTGAGLVLIAGAIRILVGAIKGLSDMNWSELGKGLAALAAIMVILVAGTRGLSGQAAGMIRTGASLVLLAAAIKILVSSVQDFSGMSWSEIAKGLAGVAALLVALGLFTKFAAVNKGAIAQSVGLVLLAAAMKILASAAADFASMNWGEIGKGLAAISAILLAVGIFTKTAGNPATLVAAGISLAGIGVGMLVLSRAVEAFSKMSWAKLAKGLVALAASLIAVGIAMNLMPKGMVVSAAGLVIVAYALVKLGEALNSFGSMSWGEIAKGLTVLAASLILIAAAVVVMQGALAGAAAMLIVAGALSALVLVLIQAGQMSWEDIGKSMVVLAGAFIIFGASAALLTPMIPSMTALGVALLALGLAAVAIGGGIALLSLGLSTLAVSGAAGVVALIGFISAVLAQVPNLLLALSNIVIGMLKIVQDSVPQMVATATTFINGMLEAIVNVAPNIIDTVITLLLDLIEAIGNAVPKFIDGATKIIVGFLNGITRMVPQVVNAIVNLIISLLNSIAQRVGDFTTAAVNLIVSFINGVASKLQDIISAGTNLIVKFVEGIAQAANKVATAAVDTFVKFLNSLQNTIRTRSHEVTDAVIGIGGAITDGIISGIGDIGGAIWRKISGGLSGLVDKVKGLFGIASPSKVFAEIGKNITLGFIKGVSGGNKDMVKTWQKTWGLMQKELETAQKDITKFQYAIAAESSKKHPNLAAIYQMQGALKQAQTEYWQTTQAMKIFTANGFKTYKQLDSLSKKHDNLVKAIEKANKKLEEARKIRDDFAASTRDQYNDLPDIDEDTNPTDFNKDLQYKLNDLKKFTDTLTKLRALGLNDTVYRELLEKGPASLGYAEQLLKGGKNAVSSVNSLSKQLDDAAAKLGNDAAKALYQAGVNAAQGVVDGLKKQQAAIDKQMATIAANLVKALKKALGIKSPSRVMAELGKYVVLGLAGGVKDTGHEVVTAVQDLGNKAVDAMGLALSGATDLLDQNGSLNPTIAPIIDLSAVRKGAGQLDSMLNDKLLNVGSSFDSARIASAGYLDNKLSALSGSGETSSQAPVDITFVQNNNSPKALSTAEIYRQTNNQLSRVRGAVAPNAS